MLTSLLAIASTLTPAPARLAPVDIPFTVADHAIIVDSQVNGKPVTCMFDTGFGGAYALNESVNVGKVTGTITLVDFVGTQEAGTVDINSLKMGGIEIPHSDMVAVKQGNNNYSLSYGTHCDGIMGLDVLKGVPFQINFENKKFVILPDNFDIMALKGDNVKTFALKMLPKGNNSIELTVKASNGEKMYLALDTGNAFYATTHKDVLERIGLWKQGTKPSFLKQSWVASGPVDSWNLRMNDLEIFGVPVKDALFDIIDLPSSEADHDGTVGFGFLKNFNITVDMKKRRVFLENWTGKVSDPPLGDVGIGAVFDPKKGRMRIYSVMSGSPADKAGIKRGDDLLSVDGNLITNITPQAVEDLMQGEVGSTIKVSTSRDGNLAQNELTRVELSNKTASSQ